MAAITMVAITMVTITMEALMWTWRAFPALPVMAQEGRGGRTGDGAWIE